MSNVLTFLCLGCLLQGATYSHVTSFFNIYALEQKGLTSTQYGIIMGSYCLVFVFVIPLTAKLVTAKRFKDKNVLFFGWTVDALFCIVTSTTSLLGRGIPFFVGTLILRIIGASGCAVGFFMLYIVLASEMNQYNHIVIPVLETIYGLSVVIGPALSGTLYDYGGYSLPFCVIGGILLITMLTALLVFPSSRQPVDSEEDSGNASDLKQAWDFPIVVNLLCSLNAFIIVSFNESTLARQLNVKFGMSASESGLMFLAAGGMYALSSLFFGFISKRVPDARYLILLNSMVAVVGLILQGPLVPIEQTKITVIVGQMLIGFGLGPTYVCAYLQSLIYLGSETKETYAALSAFYTPATSIGCTIGPLLAGIILDYFSYRVGVLVITAQLICMLAILVVAMSTAGARRSFHISRARPDPKTS